MTNEFTKKGDEVPLVLLFIFLWFALGETEDISAEEGAKAAGNSMKSP